ncbi:MAG: class A beta-lactamase-related serine hydrolase [Candidatus Omnitrophica bacterium]|nr:class A beta-lactamase-related serine hydrolase [Candidatus Omnitrophota bacterium]
MKTKTVFLAAALIFLGAGVFIAYRNYGGSAEIRAREKAWAGLKKDLQNKVGRFNGTVGLVIKDLDTGREIDLNKDTPIPSASLVKIPIMLSCYYAARDGKINLNDPVRLGYADKVGGSKVLGNKPVGSVFTVEQLLKPMITQSDNAAANLLIEHMGFDTLNIYFRKMGLKDTNLARKMMDFKERRAGEENYTTAADMADLLEELYRKKFLNDEISDKCLKLLGQQKINDRIPRKLPKGGALIAHKTGLERHICHDVGIVFTDNGDFLICVLVKHENRFAMPAKKLISDIALLTYNYYRKF